MLLALRVIKRASQRDALFICLVVCLAGYLPRYLLGYLLLCVIFASPLLAAELACDEGPVDERVVVAKIIDGDTLLLSDGRLVRLIGINTPEIGRKGKPSEALAKQARKALGALLGVNANVGLRYGQEKHDRYGRLLAHVYLHDGKNVATHMLKAGWAAQIVVPPNVGNFKCYQAAERIARQVQKGVWRGIYQPIAVEQLARDTRGFRLVTGRVTRVGKSKRSLWINFPRRPGEAPREGFAVRISHEDIKSYGDWPTNSRQQMLRGYLPNKTVIVRGWVYFYKKQLVMQVRHPVGLEVMP